MSFIDGVIMMVLEDQLDFSAIFLHSLEHNSIRPLFYNQKSAM